MALRILHIEDNADDAELVRQFIAARTSGLEYQVASDQQSLQEALSHDPFDLVLSDRDVPGVKTSAALASVRKKSTTVPFIVLSGERLSTALRDDCMRLNVDDVISKEDLRPLLLHLSRAEAKRSTDGAALHAFHPLVSTIRELSLARTPEDIASIVRRAGRALVNADGATFVLREGNMSRYVDEDALGPLFKGQSFPLDSCIGGWCMLNDDQVAIEDVGKDSRIPEGVYETTFVKSLVMTPIRGGDNAIGAIGTYWSTYHSATPEELHLLQALADSTSIAFENVRVYSELERLVQQRTAQLQLVNEELEAFSYSVSHDLRAPLRAIVGFSEHLRDEPGLTESQRQSELDRVIKAGHRMGELIDALLDLSKLRGRSLILESVDLSHIALELVAELRAHDRTRSVETHITPGISARGDRRLLTILLDNLLNNAWKYSRDAIPAYIAFGVTQGENAETIYWVKDNGVGFDPALKDQLFKPFQRLHSASQFPGSGIGLATARRIVVEHGGRIWVESAPNKGTTFYFTLSAQAAK